MDYNQIQSIIDKHDKIFIGSANKLKLKNKDHILKKKDSPSNRLFLNELRFGWCVHL